jgi:membrane fusion protein (multidrug efflux system)
MSKVLVFISFCALLYLTSCSSKTEEVAEGIKFSVTSPLRKDTLIIKDYVCQIRSIQHIELRALERGYLQKIFVDEGKFVRQGQMMFQIMPLMYKA